MRLADGAAALHTDRGHSLRSLAPFGVPNIFLADKSAASAIDPCTCLCSAFSATGSAEQRSRHRRRSHRSPVAFIVYLSPFLYSEMCQKPSIYAGFRDLLVYSNYTSPKPILPLFSFVPVGHKGLEDLGRVVVFVLC